jgi:HEAT repeat protein
VGLVRRTADAPPAPDGQPSVEELLHRLADPDAERRREAALALDEVPAGVPVLLTLVGEEPEPNVRDAMLTTLAAHDQPEVADGLIRFLASDDAGLRTAVAEALATMPDSVPPLMPRLMADPDHDVRVMTAMVLADLPHPSSLTWLTEMIREDGHPNVVAAAIDALLPSIGPEHADLLREVLRRFPDDPFLQFTVEAALP